MTVGPPSERANVREPHEEHVSGDQDESIHEEVHELLRLLRDELGIDVVYVMQHKGGMNLVRWVQAHPPHDQLEGMTQRRLDSFCQRVLEGRLPPVIPDLDALRDSHEVPQAPLPLAAYMAAPVRLHDGTSFGTVCCISFAPIATLGDRDYRRLQLCAAQLVRLINSALGWRIG